MNRSLKGGYRRMIIYSRDSQHIVLLEDLSQRFGTERLLFRYHLNETGQISDQVTLVAVGQNRWHSGRVEFNIVIVYLDEVDGPVCGYQRHHGMFNLG